ncbi:unnamed protein product, partial [Darwinula stevensoni]
TCELSPLEKTSLCVPPSPDVGHVTFLPKPNMENLTFGNPAGTDMDQAQLQQAVVEGGEPYEPHSPIYSYDEVFPALPEASVPTGNPADVNNQWNRTLRIGSSVTTQIFHVPVEERRRDEQDFGGDSQAKRCQEIMQKTGAHLEVAYGKDDSLTFVVTGKHKDVLDAKRRILEAFQTQANVTIQIPKEHHRFILGRNGKKLQDLEKATATKISVPKAENPSGEVRIMGTREGIEKAVHEIRVISDEQSKQAYERLNIPKIYHPFIAGAHSEKVNKLTEAWGVRINIPPQSVMKDELTVAGEKEAVKKVVEAIQKAYREIERHCSTVSVEVKKSQHKYIIGPKGNTIAEILGETGVSVEMPPQESPSGTITLRGPPEKLGPGVVDYDEYIHWQAPSSEMNPLSNNYAAVLLPTESLQDVFKHLLLLGSFIIAACFYIAALTMVYSKANSVKSTEMKAPAWLHKYIIGKKGVNIRNLTQDNPKVHVEFNEGDKIQLEGPPKEVDEIEDKLTAVIQDLEQRLTFEELEVDTRFHRHIIGRQGANGKSNYDMNRIKQETGVFIRFPDGETLNKILIEGSRDGVKRAVKDLKELVEKIQNEKERDIIIPQRFHPKIIGSKGENIRETRDRFNNVQITFPAPGVASEIVKIRGPKDDVDACYSHLRKVCREMEDSSFQVEVQIYKQFHKFVIGKGGANIRKIREETNTRIEIPGDESESDKIVITGKKEDCEKAKDMIQKIQNDMDNVVQVDIIVPQKFHNAIIGTGGKLIQSISQDCGGAYIKFPPSDVSSDKVTIRGPKEEVAKAKKIIIEMSNERQLMNYTAEVRDSTGARIIFPTEKDEDREVITIIGREEAVKKAKAELEVLIKELVGPSLNSSSNVGRCPILLELHSKRKATSMNLHIQKRLQHLDVEYSIDRDCVAIIILETVQADHSTNPATSEALENHKWEKVAAVPVVLCDDTVVEEEVRVDAKHHRHFTSRRGAVLQEISENYGGVIISFPRANETHDRVLLKGSKECVDGAKQRILEIVSDLEQMVTMECEIPQRHHRTIMGAKGSKVQAIEAEFDVRIKFPEREVANGEEGVPEMNGVIDSKEPLPRDIIKVTGKVENCERAKAALFECIPIVIDVPVPFDFHRFIIGLKGKEVRDMMMKYDVNITVPPAKDHADTIKVTGPPANVERAKEALEEKVKQLHAEKEDRAARSYELRVCVFFPFDEDCIFGPMMIKCLSKAGLMPWGLERTGAEELCSQVQRVGIPSTREGKGQRPGSHPVPFTSALGKMNVEAKYHPKIIGRRGATVTKLRDDYGVNIQFPNMQTKEDEPDVIIITGYEDKAHAASDAIMKMVNDMREMKEEEVSIDHRVHSRLIGQRGRNIRRIMEQFKVDIRFPRQEDTDPNRVVIMGHEEDIQEAKDYLLNLEEEFLQDVTDSEMYYRPSRYADDDTPKGDSKSFVVKGGPWEQGPAPAPDMKSNEDFPSFGDVSAAPVTPGGAWGSHRRI